MANSVNAVAVAVTVTAFSPVRLRLRGGALKRRDVELLHLQHRLHHAVRLGAIRIAEQARQRGRNDLPGDAELVLEPAALLDLSAGAEPVPEVVHLRLRLAGDVERDRFVELEMRSAVERGELQAFELER